MENKKLTRSISFLTVAELFIDRDNKLSRWKSFGTFLPSFLSTFKVRFITLNKYQSIRISFFSISPSHPCAWRLNWFSAQLIATYTIHYQTVGPKRHHYRHNLINQFRKHLQKPLIPSTNWTTISLLCTTMKFKSNKRTIKFQSYLEEWKKKFLVKIFDLVFDFPWAKIDDGGS